MDQNTQEWIKWRNAGVGASDAPVIMGRSPHKNARQLFLEKIGQIKDEKKNDFIQKKGLYLERAGRAYIEVISGLMFPAMLFVHPTYEWMRASLDGYNQETKTIFEGKFIGEKDFEIVDKNKKVLDHHYDQIQHQLFVTNGTKCFYCCYVADGFAIKNITHIEVLPDPERQKEIFEKEKEFWERVLKKEWPENQNELSIKYVSLYNEIKSKEKELEDIKTKILALDGFTKDDNIEIVTRKTKGRIDYDELIKQNNIDAEKFRKPETTSRSIKIL